MNNTPKGIRIPVLFLKRKNPKPLDDRGANKSVLLIKRLSLPIYKISKKTFSKNHFYK